MVVNVKRMTEKSDESLRQKLDVSSKPLQADWGWPLSFVENCGHHLKTASLVWEAVKA